MRLWIDGGHLGLGSVGIGVVAARLIRALTRTVPPGWSVALYLPTRAPSPAWLPRRVEVLRLRSPKTGYGFLDTCLWQNRLTLARRESREKGIFLSPGPSAAVLRCDQDVVLFHDCIPRHFPEYLRRRWTRRGVLKLQERHARHARCLVTESEHAASDIAAQLGVDRARIRVVPAWLPEAFSPARAAQGVARVRRRYGLPPRFWLYAGGYDLRKNIELLVRAYAEARQHAACPPLVLAGSVPANLSHPVCDVLGAIRRSILTASEVVTPGHIADDDLPGLYAAAELFIYPSRFEGFGLPPLEAMGCGCPALVADATSLREVVVDGGYRFSPDHPGELAALLARAAVRPLPPNPGFDREAHEEARAAASYWSILASLAPR